MKHIKVIEFQKELIDAVFDIQQKAYKSLFDKYHDKNTIPYLESKKDVLEKYTRRSDTCRSCQNNCKR